VLLVPRGGGDEMWRWGGDGGGGGGDGEILKNKLCVLNFSTTSV